MAAPEAHLPPSIPSSTIQNLLAELSLPPASSIEPLQVTAAFHSIYLLHFPVDAKQDLVPAKAADEDGRMTLVLRVSGNHIRRTKTLNEVAVLRWVRENCPSIPVPAVVRYDADEDNALGHEFTILEKVPGRSVDKMYKDMSEETKRKLVVQLTDMTIELNRHDWHHVGGLQISEDGEIEPGPALEDTFWLIPDIEKYWDARESVKTLNPAGKYAAHTEFVQGYLSAFVHAIKTHQSLEWLRGTFEDRLVALAANLPDMQNLNKSRLVLAHKDLHFANVMATEDGTITGILDWEFAGVVPALRWDPVRAFLWNGDGSEESGEEKAKLRQVFEDTLKEKGVLPWWEADTQTEDIWTVIRFVRAIVEVCPRGQKLEAAKGWRDSASEALNRLGV